MSTPVNIKTYRERGENEGQLKVILRGWDKLTTLSLSFFDLRGMDAAFARFLTVRGCQLTSMRLGGVDIDEGALDSLVACTNLRTLGLPVVCSDDLKAVSKLQNLRDLKVDVDDVDEGYEFDLRHLKSDIIDLFKKGNFKNLESVALSGYDIDDDVVKVVAKSCPVLTSVDLGFCHQVTNAGVNFLLRNCPEVHNLVLGGCFNVSRVGLGGMADLLPDLKLRHLVIDATEFFREDLESLRASLRELKVSNKCDQCLPFGALLKDVDPNADDDSYFVCVGTNNYKWVRSYNDVELVLMYNGMKL